MKNFIYILTAFIAIILSSSVSHAQWVSKHTPADELTGATETTLYAYKGADGSLAYWDDSSEVQVIADRGVFDYNSYGSSLRTVDVTIGFYEEGSLTEKTKATFYVPKGQSDKAVCINAQVGKQIINYLENGKKVRFVIPRYGKTDFDFEVPPREETLTL